MGTPFMSEVKIVSFNFPPKGWAMCNGQFLPINQNQALFSLLGTMYGGNGQTNFALPDLRGKAPLHLGSGFTQGQVSGQESHTLTLQELPQHIHFAQATPTPQATAVIPNNTLVLGQSQFDIYRPASSLGSMIGGTVSNVGGSQPHTNMQPYLVLNYIIALQGVFPSRN
jgi:microcystin-dependent protein